MIFFLVMPGLFGGFGNYFVPIFQGSPEVVYPRVNNFSILILSLSYLFLILSLISEFGGGTGWTLYPPLSTSLMSLSPSSTAFMVFGLLMSGISSCLTSLNFWTTILNLRSYYLTLKTIPLFRSMQSSWKSLTILSWIADIKTITCWELEDRWYVFYCLSRLILTNYRFPMSFQVSKTSINGGFLQPGLTSGYNRFPLPWPVSEASLITAVKKISILEIWWGQTSKIWYTKDHRFYRWMTQRTAGLERKKQSARQIVFMLVLWKPILFQFLLVKDVSFRWFPESYSNIDEETRLSSRRLGNRWLSRHWLFSFFSKCWRSTWV